METLKPDVEGFTHLLMALVKTRSIAKENGTFDLLGPWEFHPGLEPWTANPKTVEMLAAFQSGEKECPLSTWLNIVHMVESSPGWALGLVTRGVEMPSKADVIAEMSRGGE